MQNKLPYSTVYSLVIGFFALLMLVFPKLIVLGFLAIAGVVIAGLIKKEIVFRLNTISILFICLYLLYAVYAIFTRHTDLAGRYFENKLSFAILPLLLSFRLKKPANYYWSIVIYLVAIAVLIIESYSSAISCYVHGGGRACFLASLFSFQHHPSYTSVFYILAMALLVYGWKQKLTGFKMYWVAPAIFLLFVSIILCLSLAGILFLFGLIAVVALVLIYQKWGKLVAGAAVLITPFALYLSIISIPQVEGEWTNAKWYADEYAKSPEAFIQKRKYPMSGTEVRIVMWTVSAQVFMKFPFGVGTGNVDEVLTYHLNRLDQKELAKQEYNPHNQFLQTGVEIGLFGLMVLLAIVAVGIYKAFKNKNWLLLLVVLSLAFNSLFESMLQRQSGIVFYTFAIVLLSTVSNEKLKIFNSKKAK